MKRRRGLSPPPPPEMKRRRALGAKIGNEEVMLLLFETPSGFAIFNFLATSIDQPDALENIWAKFTKSWRANCVVWLKQFQTFEDKSSAINQNTGVNERLTKMIMKWHCPGQKMAVGKPEYQKIIEARLKIPCVYNPTVMELMWGIQNCMPHLVPREKSQWTEEDCLPMSQGLQNVLSRYDCNVKPQMVNERIVATASALFECDSVDKDNSSDLLGAGDLIKDVSGINCEDWSLLKIATALKMIWWPEKVGDSCEMISEDEVSRLVNDAHKYEVYLSKDACLGTYKDMVSAHDVRTSKKKLLKSLIEEAKEAYEAEQAEVPEKNINFITHADLG